MSPGKHEKVRSVLQKGTCQSLNDPRMCQNVLICTPFFGGGVKKGNRQTTHFGGGHKFIVSGLTLFDATTGSFRDAIAATCYSDQAGTDIYVYVSVPLFMTEFTVFLHIARAMM